MDNLEDIEYTKKIRILRISCEEAIIRGKSRDTEILSDQAYELTFYEYMRYREKCRILRGDLLKPENSSCVFELMDLKEKYEASSSQYANLLNKLAEKCLGGNLKLV
jgi:hypothetical protein